MLYFKKTFKYMHFYTFKTYMLFLLIVLLNSINNNNKKLCMIKVRLNTRVGAIACQ